MCRIWSMDLAQPRQQGIDIGMLTQQPIDQHPIAAPQWVGEVGCQPVRLVIIVDDATLRLGQVPGFAQPFPLPAQRVGGNAEILDELDLAVEVTPMSRAENESLNGIYP